MRFFQHITACFLLVVSVSFLSCASTAETVRDPSAIPVQSPSSFEVEYTGMTFVLVPSGSFEMGSPQDEPGRDPDEGPRHRVEISAFYMGKCEVTQAQWQELMGKNPSVFKGDPALPVENVSWEMVQRFVRAFSRKTGFDFRLPTEAEWEYACRAGTQTAFFCGDDEKGLGEYAWYSANSGEETHPVGMLKPNRFGLYDMHGNVSEWVGDGRRGYVSEPVKDPKGGINTKKALHRGGCWLYPARYLRSANRMDVEKDFSTHIIGFRLAIDRNAIDFSRHLK